MGHYDKTNGVRGRRDSQWAVQPWDDRRRVRVGGEPVWRCSLRLTAETPVTRTTYLGTIPMPHDVGRKLVVDFYDDGSYKDVIVD